MACQSNGPHTVRPSWAPGESSPSSCQFLVAWGGIEPPARMDVSRLAALGWHAGIGLEDGLSKTPTGGSPIPHRRPAHESATAQWPGPGRRDGVTRHDKISRWLPRNALPCQP